MSFSLKKFFRKSYAFRSLYWLGVLNWFDLAARLSRVPKLQRRKKRVAFVKMDGIGDYVIWSAAFSHLRDLYPSDKYERILIGNDRFRQLAEVEPTFDEKIFVNLDRFAVVPTYRYRSMKQIRDLNVDIIVNARSARDLLWSDSMVRCSAALEKIGSEGAGNLMGPIQQRLTRTWYTVLRSAPIGGEHELITNLKFLGSPHDEPSMPGPIGPDTASPVPQPYAVFFLGAQIAEKRWSAANFGNTAALICEKYGLIAVICGGPEDRRLADGFSESSNLEHVDMIGKTTLAELSSLLRSASVVISNDTGAAHLAVLNGARTVVIASGNEVGRYFPYPEAVATQLKAIQHPELCIGCKEACIHSRWSETATRPCVEKVSVQEVVNAADELLGETAAAEISSSDPAKA